MDVIPIGARPTPGHRRFIVIWKVSTSAQVLDGFIHARRESRRRSVQERDIRGWSQSPVVDQRRGRFAGTAGKL